MDLYQIEDYTDSLRMASALPLSWEKIGGKSVVIAGATGLIGRCMIDLLMYMNKAKDLRCHIYALSRNEGSARKRLSESYFQNPYFTFQPHDVQKSLKLNGEERVDYVLHLASNTHPVAYATKPIDTILTNILGTRNLLDFCVNYQAERFVFLSSVEIYGENRGSKERFFEDDMGYLNCNMMRAGYPESKRCGEALCQAYRAEKGLDIVIPRLPRVYGPTMLETDSKAAAQFIKKAVEGQDIILKSEGKQRYSFLHALDAVTGILTVMLQGKNGEAYNVADKENDALLRDVAELAAGMAGKNVVYDLPNELEQKGYSTATKAMLDGEKIRELGWKPCYTIESGIRSTIAVLWDAES